MSTTVQPPASQPAALSDRQIVPALVDGQTVYLECPTWCMIDHVHDSQKFLEDIWHSGTFADLEAPRRNGSPSVIAYARLGLDPFSRDEEMRRPFIFVEDGGSSEGSYMEAEHAEQFADNLEAFAAKIRAMAAAMRGAA